MQGGNIPAGPVTLTLADAVKLGFRANLGVLTADDSARASRAQRLSALSNLLPYVSIDATETSTQINLAAFGFKFNIPPGVGFSIPTVVGPFQYSQLLGNLSQSVWDPVARRNWHASQESERASQPLGPRCPRNGGAGGSRSVFGNHRYRCSRGFAARSSRQRASGLSSGRSSQRGRHQRPHRCHAHLGGIARPATAAECPASRSAEGEAGLGSFDRPAARSRTDSE